MNFEYKGKRYLNEAKELNESGAGIARIMKHVNSDYPIAFITAFKGDLPYATNSAKNNQLAKILRKLNYGWVKLKGVYTDNFKQTQDPTRPEKRVREDSFMVICTEPSKQEQFKKQMIRLMIRYQQPNFLFVDRNAQAMLVSTSRTSDIGAIGKFKRLGRFIPMKTEDFYSERKGAPFTFKTEYDDSDMQLSETDDNSYTPVNNDELSFAENYALKVMRDRASDGTEEEFEELCNQFIDSCNKA